jgi:hypothetical protein
MLIYLLTAEFPFGRNFTVSERIGFSKKLIICEILTETRTPTYRFYSKIFMRSRFSQIALSSQIFERVPFDHDIVEAQRIPMETSEILGIIFAINIYPAKKHVNSWMGCHRLKLFI